VNGSRSIGLCRKKSDHDKMIFAFRVYGKLYWSGDLEHLRATKAEAWADVIDSPLTITEPGKE
jgi:hypothetical protein